LKRADIQVLRGFAVASVVLYHLRPDVFSGGWVGVDIFFVISGYLIAGHFSKNPNFEIKSILLFYKKRFLRIAPSLLPLVILSAGVACFFFVEEHYLEFLNSGFSSLTFWSNFYFWKQTGYFSNLVDTLPLLHTWSL
jgi:peptidoglycan/LPS O-acetylase OafA/YrhL